MTLAAGDGTDQPDPEPRAALDRGDLVGRYVIMAQVGQGGMGVVYAAYDPELDRKVALKLLHGGVTGTVFATNARARLLREAQALAQLAHPNVVAVFDVGQLGDKVWLAMEYVDGLTVRAWLQQRPRAWQDIVAVFRAAGEGLMAAHAAGLVHRDFKPDNVMLGADGRVRVMDFGVARADRAAGRPLLSEQTGLESSISLRSDITRAGSLLGTPAYMAPEQWYGAALDARTDQFSFCIALWEALYGERPYHGDTVTELAQAVVDGRRKLPRKTAVPSWLRKLLERGLAVIPDDRFPSMQALLLALAGGARKRRRRRFIAAALALAALAGALAGLRRYDREQRIAACEATAASLDEAWNDAARHRIATSLRATGRSYADATHALVVAYVDPFAARWSAARGEVCRLAEVERAWNDDVAARATGCLAEARWALEGLVELLSHADAAVVDRAAQAAASLPRPDACLDPTALARRRPPPRDPDAQAEAAAIGRALERVASLRVLGKYREGADEAEALVVRADALGWTPLAVEARIAAGILRGQLDEPQRGADRLHDAIVLASETGSDEQLADAASELTFVLSSRLGRHDEALQWGRFAQAWMARLGKLDTPRGARLLNNIANVHYGRGDYAAARRLHERALAARQAIFGPEHPDVAGSRNNFGLVLLALGDLEGSRRMTEQAVAIVERTLGPEHPNLVGSVGNLGRTLNLLGRWDEAELALRRAIALGEQTLGEDNVAVANAVNNLANLLDDRGRQTEAADLYRRAIAIKERLFGPDDAAVASILGNLASTQHARGLDDEALAMYERALPILERDLGPDHVTIAAHLTGAAQIHLDLGHLDEAQRLAERAMAIRERALGREHPEIAGTLVYLGDIHRARGELAAARRAYDESLALAERLAGRDDPALALPLLGLAELALRERRPAEAVPRLRRALSLLPPDAVRHRLRGDVRFALARALWDARKDPDAPAFALAAAEDFTTADATKQREQALAWLGARR